MRRVTASGPAGRGPTEADISAAVAAASRSLGVPPEPPGEVPFEPGEGPTGRPRAVWIAVGLLVVGIAATVAMRGAGFREQPAHLVEADLRWAVAKVVEHVEEERLLRGRLPAESELRLLTGEALSFTATERGYRVVGRRDGVRVEWDGSVPLEEWRTRVLHPPGPTSR